MRVIIAHHLAHKEWACAAAKEAGIKLTLQTPPHGLQVHGLAMLMALFEVPCAELAASQYEWILDCGAEAALAVEAMRLGVKNIRVYKALPLEGGGLGGGAGAKTYTPVLDASSGHPHPSPPPSRGRGLEEKLRDIAAQLGATIHTGPCEALDLAETIDPAASISRFLAREPT